MAAFDLSLLRCACGLAVPVMAVQPGTDHETAADLFTLTRAVPARGFCASCWAMKFADGRLNGPVLPHNPAVGPSAVAGTI